MHVHALHMKGVAGPGAAEKMKKWVEWVPEFERPIPDLV